MVKLEDIKIGDKVLVKGGFGMDKPVIGTVTDVEEDIKNGIEGICYDLADGEGRWAYLYQVNKILKKDEDIIDRKNSVHIKSLSKSALECILEIIENGNSYGSFEVDYGKYSECIEFDITVNVSRTDFK